MIDLSLARPVMRALEQETRKTASALRRGAASALNKTARTARTQASREIRKTLALKAARVNKELRILKATRNDLEASVVCYYKPIKVTEFTGTRRVRRGLSVKPRKDRPRYVIPAFTIPGAGTRMFKRVSPGERWSKDRPHTSSPNLPIAEPYGPPVMQLFKERLPQLIRFSEDVMRRNLDREIGYYLSRLNG